ncbi:hypothetical protein ILYODFUR_022054 [Ilyodon furcidens]|uniref:Uncharacterized protein n=1 Tax=Ilyodon furcidens TaxID=33524 RepID=A0ABV0TM84_9TELE
MFFFIYSSPLEESQQNLGSSLQKKITEVPACSLKPFPDADQSLPFSCCLQDTNLLTSRHQSEPGFIYIFPGLLCLCLHLSGHKTKLKKPPEDIALTVVLAYFNVLCLEEKRS